MVFQWLIQDFPEGNANPKGGANLLFGIILAEKNGLREGRVSLAPHPRPATDIIFMVALTPFTKYHQV